MTSETPISTPYDFFSYKREGKYTDSINIKQIARIVEAEDRCLVMIMHDWRPMWDFVTFPQKNGGKSEKWEQVATSTQVKLSQEDSNRLRSVLGQPNYEYPVVEEKSDSRHYRFISAIEEAGIEAGKDYYMQGDSSIFQVIGIAGTPLHYDMDKLIEEGITELIND